MSPAAADSSPAGPLILHAGAVAVQGRGLLILGPSGSGKSGLALQLMALGAALVSDDLTCLTAGADGRVMLSAPPAGPGWIEARGLGLLHAAPSDPAPLALAVDMARPETERLPPRRETVFLGQTVPLLHRIDAPYFPAAILQYLRWGRAE